MALGVEPPEPDVMERPPRPPDQRIITLRRGVGMLYHGALNACAAAVAFYAIYYGREANVPAARTAAFATLAFGQLLFSFGCRSDRYTLPQLGFLTNPWLLGAIAVSAALQLAALTIPFLQPVFKVVPITSAWEWLMILALAAAPVTIIEVAKLVRARLGGPAAPHRSEETDPKRESGAPGFHPFDAESTR
jgi:Ca2+-transporting ATPase